jgi:Tfp pilus assembly protein PilF
MHHPAFRASVTCVRVPVYRAHSIAISAEFDQPVTVEAALAVLRQAPGLDVLDNPAKCEYPLPLYQAEKDNCAVGRVRKDCAMDNGLWADGEKYLLEALSIRPDFPRATYALARAYLGQSKNQPAEEQMRKYLAARPNDASAQYGLGFILVAEQKVEEARAAFEKSLAIQPLQTESGFQLGEISLQQDKRDQAKEEFQKVLERDPRHAGALTEIGLIEFRAGNLAEARTTLAKAATLAPSYYKAHYYYALTLKKLGNKEEAEREFRIATDLQKHDAPMAHLAPDRQ